MPTGLRLQMLARCAATATAILSLPPGPTLARAPQSLVPQDAFWQVVAAARDDAERQDYASRADEEAASVRVQVAVRRYLQSLIPTTYDAMTALLLRNGFLCGRHHGCVYQASVWNEMVSRTASPWGCDWFDQVLITVSPGRAAVPGEFLEDASIRYRRHSDGNDRRCRRESIERVLPLAELPLPPMGAP
jgi:hypothetical protein